MKIQYLAVIFIVIILPISMVLSQYIENQIDTITLQTTYTNSLNNATFDALKAFQLNTVNNKYSTLSDSKIRDVEAAISTFYNSLETSMSKYIYGQEVVPEFVPAILFTLYDGYYIYSSYDNIYTTTGVGEDLRVEIKDDDNRYQIGLKPYIYYSCQYKLNSGKKVIVNYTLDNAITVYGDFGSGYETKSGYLIDYSKVQNRNTTNKTLEYNGVLIEPETLTEYLLTLNETTGTLESGDYNYIVYKNKKVYYDPSAPDMTKPYFWYDNYRKTYLQRETENVNKYINDNGVGFKSISAFEYYSEAYEFSKWVVETSGLGDVKQSDIVQNNGTIGANIAGGELYLSTNTGTEEIFNTTAAGNDPMLSSSTFNAHREAVIRKSIETNLMTAIANFNIQDSSSFEFILPIIDEERWYQIVNNVSIVSFMQGIPIAQKYYNNYSVIINTKNEEIVNENSVYVVTTEGTSVEYHQPGCEELRSKQDKITGTYSSLDFQRQTVKVSESNIHYFYPQARQPQAGQEKWMTGCYNCIVNATGNYYIDDIISNNVKDSAGNILNIDKVRKAYLTGIARERYDLYRTSKF